MAKMTAKTSKIALSIVSVAILAACSPSGVPPQTETSTPSTQASSETVTESITAVASIPNLNDPSEIKFMEMTPETSLIGYMDHVGGSSKTTHALPNELIIVSGWAILPEKNKPADLVIVTAGDENTIVGAGEVDQDRSDVAQAINNPAAKMSGWMAAIEPSVLPSKGVLLKAWAYDSETKEAHLLGGIHEVTVAK